MLIILLQRLINLRKNSKNSSIQYASDVFKYVESNLERTLEALQENRQTLHK